ncbi:MAG: winged helix-turn-helix domain-containing protein [Bacteroidia bacterium]|nr:winged helix-turn-helix domain-containing protein [Bacteroidia bacterium]
MNVKNKFTVDKILKVSLLCFLVLVTVSLAQSLSKPNEQLAKKQAQLAVRAIGDGLLSNAHDFHSPVLPVEEIGGGSLRLSFKDHIPINPDSLSGLAMKHLSSEIAPRAIVHVLDVASKKLVYGFEINHQDPKEIPCLGRNLPKSDYYVDVSFYEHKQPLLGLNAITFGILGLVLVSVALFRNLSIKEKTQKPTVKATIQLKGIQFELDTNQILTKDKKIKLTNKEAQIFSILFENEGQLVSRDYLTQEVWLKEGVVTGRSLDMYISRLRKKLTGLSNVEILNQRGKGYTLKV